MLFCRNQRHNRIRHGLLLRIDNVRRNFPRSTTDHDFNRR
jgi:hypothetical protein